MSLAVDPFACSSASSVSMPQRLQKNCLLGASWLPTICATLGRRHAIEGQENPQGHHVLDYCLFALAFDRARGIKNNMVGLLKDLRHTVC